MQRARCSVHGATLSRPASAMTVRHTRLAAVFFVVVAAMPLRARRHPPLPLAAPVSGGFSVAVLLDGFNREQPLMSHGTLIEAPVTDFRLSRSGGGAVPVAQSLVSAGGRAEGAAGEAHRAGPMDSALAPAVRHGAVPATPLPPCAIGRPLPARRMRASPLLSESFRQGRVSRCAL